MLEADNCLTVLKEAIARYGNTEIINSNQGSQFTCAVLDGIFGRQAGPDQAAGFNK